MLRSWCSISKCERWNLQKGTCQLSTPSIPAKYSWHGEMKKISSTKKIKKPPIAKNLKTIHQTKTLHGNHFMMQKFLPVHLTKLGCPKLLILTWGGESQSVSESVRVSDPQWLCILHFLQWLLERFSHAYCCCCWYMTNIRNKRVFQKVHWTKFFFFWWWWWSPPPPPQQQQQQQQHQISKFCKLFFHPFQQHFLLLWCFFWGHTTTTTTTDDATKQTLSAQFMSILPISLRPTPKIDDEQQHSWE